MKLNILAFGLLLLVSCCSCDLDNSTDLSKDDGLFSNFGSLFEQITSKIDSLKNLINETFHKGFSIQKRQNFDAALASTLVSNQQPFKPHVGLQSSPGSRNIDRLSSAALDVSQRIASGSRRNGNEVPMQRISSLKAPQELCPFKRVSGCDPNSKFRTFDGSCNNLQNPWWGKNEIPYKRFLPAEYSDGLQQPRMFSKSGRELPNPRLVSRALADDNGQTETFYTHLLAIFGQFLAHDVTSVAISTGKRLKKPLFNAFMLTSLCFFLLLDEKGAIVDCPCGSTNPSCFSIPMPFGETIMQTQCLTFTRSSAAFPTTDCRLGK